jgi:hypothetical protein
MATTVPIRNLFRCSMANPGARAARLFRGANSVTIASKTMKRRSVIASLIAVACIEPAAARDVQRPAAIPLKPVVLGESHYDGEWGPQPHDFTMRKQAYWAVLSGAAGHAYGAKGMCD